ncbi:Hydroxymethylpyrimidine/phosphomethylpyrimidine kinase [Corynebacterium atrinae]|nr:Hydroxymethylpyrimidine/phosphomethylpyrimidine kinase [Corynebacterium atrinae]
MTVPDRILIPRILSIAGTDPTGGAGIQADLKAIMAAGGYGMAVVTALVSQNTRGVRSVFTPPPAFLADQLEAVFTDVTVDAIKVGMLGDAQTVETVRAALRRFGHGPVILDPVMVASSGDRLLDEAAEEAVRALVADVDVVTPNLQELAVLVELDPAETFDDAVAQAADLARTSGTVIIVKGGHLSGPLADNAVVHPSGDVHRVPSPRVDTKNTHGTGCSLSSAVATRIGAGNGVEQAVAWSTRWLHEAIMHADALDVGSGRGPVDHGHRGRRLADAASTAPWPHLYVHLPSRPAPAPRLTPAGPFTNKLWGLTGDVWSEIMELPFIRGLRSGTLPAEDFDFYGDQHSQFSDRYCRALATLAAPGRGLQLGWSATSAPSPVTMAYADFLIATNAVDDEVVRAAAGLPRYWLTAEIALDLKAEQRATNPWTATFGSEVFLQGTIDTIAHVERMLSRASDQQREAATRAYLTACTHEREFFAQADRAW